ncbi:CotH kinase family protein [Emticicia sp. C21]|uniref:CotH kinase family protein n=1 Tax=Emticicia sp. C21 TaxID=2302915 RepID=UPI000E34D070|nr:CotH kinase family protein [Emticicia sp. C21]RFS16813.1 T9SS C-terminal target domain-containing protein [Emticicia sp. C21]
MRKFYFNLLVLCFYSAFALAQNFDSSNLPIIFINTQGGTIADDPKIKAKMDIIYNGPGKVNHMTDKPNHYSGFIGIEYRGSSSQMFPKKSLGIELWDDKNNSKDASLFGMPEESDWILYASYNEKSLMHNVVTMKLAREMGIYASRTQYVEVFINNQYMGVYVFMEKIKRAPGRVDISKLKEDDLKGDDITGGYIIKVDKTTGSTLGGWTSQYYNNNSGNNRTYYQYEAPKTITSQQKSYISSYFITAETALQSNNFRDKVNGYRKYFDTQSFIKLFLTNEIAKNLDGYRISTYFYKDKDSKGGKIKAGPPWDYDLTYGNGNYCEGQSYTGFAYQFNNVCPTDGFQVPFWWERMMEDSAFVRELGEEYAFQRRKGAFQLDKINKYIDSLTAQLQAPASRNFQRWPILGTYVWPQPNPISNTWFGEIDELKQFVANRLNWLDANIKQPTDLKITANEENATNILSMNAYPNPFLDRIYINIHSPKSEKANLVLYDTNGKVLTQIQETLQVGENKVMIQVPSSLHLSSINLLQLEANGRTIVKKMMQQ